MHEEGPSNPKKASEIVVASKAVGIQFGFQRGCALKMLVCTILRTRAFDVLGLASLQCLLVIVLGAQESTEASAGVRAGQPGVNHSMSLQPTLNNKLQVCSDDLEEDRRRAT